MKSAARSARRTAAGAMITAALALVAACASQPRQSAAPSPQPSATSAVPSIRTAVKTPARHTTALPSTVVGALGRYQVGDQDVTFTEPAHLSAAGQDLGPRTLVTEVWYPLEGSQPAAGPLPLIMFGPGFMMCPGPYAPLLEAWASAGYVVAGVSFPRTNCHLGDAAYEPDMVNQPADLSYALTQLLALSARPSGLFSGLINPRQIAAAGQSDGGDTVAALAANTCCIDRRVTAVAVLSGAEWPPMPGRYFAAPTAPMLFVQGSADTINPPWTSVKLYDSDVTGIRYYLDLFGADHLGPYTTRGPVESVVANVTVAFFDRYVLGRASALATMTRAGNVTGAELVGGSQPAP